MIGAGICAAGTATLCARFAFATLSQGHLQRPALRGFLNPTAGSSSSSEASFTLPERLPALAASAVVLTALASEGSRRSKKASPSYTALSATEAEESLNPVPDMPEESLTKAELKATKGLIKAIKKAKEKDLNVVQVLKEGDVITSPELLVRAMRALRLSGFYGEVVTLFEEFESQFTAEVKQYAELMYAFMLLGRWLKVFETYAKLKSLNLVPSLFCCNIVLRVFAMNKTCARAIEFLREMNTDNIAPDVYSFDFLLSSCPTRKNWDLTINVLNSMQAAKVSCNFSCCRSAMHNLSYSSYWQEAVRLYEDMKLRGIPADEDILRYLLRTCFAYAPFQEAMKLFKGLEADTKVVLTKVHFDMAINLCEREGRWQEVLSFASSMGARGVSPDPMTCTAVLKACIELGKSDIALKLLGTMERDGTQLSRTAYLIVLNACAESKKWDDVLRLFEDLRQKSSTVVDREFCLPVITALAEVGREDEALALYRETCSAPSMPLELRRLQSPLPLLLDACGLAPQAARIVLRAAIEGSTEGDEEQGSTSRLSSLAGFSPAGPKDVIIAIHSDDIEGYKNLKAVENSMADALIKAAQQALGSEVQLIVCNDPFPSVKIPGVDLQAVLVQQA